MGEQVRNVKHQGYDCVQFDITVTMKQRWVPQFLSMLAYMQKLGGWGSSREVAIFADGDGDFRPKFEWPDGLMDEPVPPVRDVGGDHFYDAG